MSTKRRPRPTLYKKLRDTLASELSAGLYAIGSRFPTEQELCQRFGLGRHTVREALRGLQEDGLISRRQGSGTVVTAQVRSEVYTQRIDSLENLWQYATATRFDKRLVLLVTLREELAKSLGRSPGERWLRIAGFRRPTEGSNPPLCWSEIFVAEPWIGIRDYLRTTDMPVYSALIKHFGLQITEVERYIVAIAMPPDIAVRLNVKPGMPTLMERRSYYNKNGDVVEITLSIHPGDSFAHTSRLLREHGPSDTSTL
jgi:DNA-binding GntR family transcriptional regulator